MGWRAGAVARSPASADPRDPFTATASLDRTGTPTDDIAPPPGEVYIGSVIQPPAGSATSSPKHNAAQGQWLQ